MISNFARLADKSIVNLLCSTLSTLAPEFAQIFEIIFNCPGLSGIVIVIVVICLALTKSLIKIEEMILESIFPPHKIIPTFLFLNVFWFSIIAAKPTAPAPSTTTFSVNANIAIACSIDESDTWITLSILSLI